jgi:hypothetical protein
MSKKIKFKIEEGEYKGSPTLTFKEIDDNNNEKPFGSFTLGVKKLKAILDNEETVKEFLKGK